MPSVAKLFDEMPNVFNVEKAGDMDATVQFDLSGEGGGQWYVSVAGGNCSVEQGTIDDPTSTIRMEASDYADMIAGRLDPMTAFIQQKVKVEGDLNTVMKFQTLFDN
ncbi:MAG: SCP2 sterol-binding domain-containing protein [Candidatus Promineifilaceae bacterium]